MKHVLRHLRAPALATSLLAVPLAACGKSGFEGPMTFGNRVVEVATLERGQDLYRRYCATCHGYTGKADTPQARQLDPHPRDLSQADYKRVSSPGALPTDKELGDIIRNGIPGTGMPPWPQLEGSDLDAVIQYLKTFSPRWQTPTPETPQNAPKGAMKALPGGRTTASFRAADDLVALAQGMGTTDAASRRPLPRSGHTYDNTDGLRPLRAAQPEDTRSPGRLGLPGNLDSLGRLRLPSDAPTYTDLNPRTAR